MAMDFQPGDADILVRAFRGEDVERYSTFYSPPPTYILALDQQVSLILSFLNYMVK
jgi:hypothetical protein